MRAIFLLVLVVGLGLAGAAVYMIQDYIAQTENMLKKEREFNARAGKLVEVYVFNKQLKYGDPLKEADAQLIFWPERHLPKGVFRTKEELFPENAKGPRYVMRSTEPFEPIIPSRVTEPGEVAGLTSKLGPGMRAFDIRVGVGTGVAGFVQPDDFVDIYWTGLVRGYDNSEVTRLIESSIQIIAVGSSIGQGQATSGAARSVTVAATPEQVARLTQAQSSGRLSMSLVGDTADVRDTSIELDTKTLFGIEEKQVEVVEAEKVCTIKSNRGGEIVETVIPCRD
jgi:pilus assembly protein CpaB